VHRPLENESEKELAVVRRHGARRAADDARSSAPSARRGDPAALGRAVGEALAIALRVGAHARRRQRQRRIAVRRMNGGRADLDDLEAGGALEPAVTKPRRLEDDLAGLHDERLALILVHEPDPALVAVDHLEPDLVEVHVVGDGAAVRDPDVGSDETTTLPI